MTHPYRTHAGGRLTPIEIGRQVRLSGLVEHVRDLGKLAFATLRDSTGVVQLISHQPQTVAAFRALRTGTAVTVDGEVARRPAHDANPGQRTGEIEVRVSAVVVHRDGAVRPHVPAPDLAVARTETAVRRILGELGFTAVDERTAGPLSALLYAHDRVYRIRTTTVADATVRAGARPARILACELGFATLDDLTGTAWSLVRGLADVLTPDLPPRCVESAPSDTAALPWTGEPGLALLVGLPASGHTLLNAHDRPLTLLAEPWRRSSRSDAQPTSDALVQGLLLGVNGRIVGAGAVRRDDPQGLAAMAEAEDTVDPLLAEELRAAADAAAHRPPGAGWFALDLDRLTDATVPGGDRDHTKEQLTDPQGIGVDDLEALLRAVDAGPAAAHRAACRPDPDAAAERVDRWDVEASAAMIRSRGARPTGPSTSGETTDAFGLRAMQAVLDDFGMDADVCERLLALVPAAGARFPQMPAGERFSWVWSILGSDSVRTLLRDPDCYAVLHEAVELRILTDPKQVVHLDVPAVRDLAGVLGGIRTADARAGLVTLLRQVLATAPNSFAALLCALNAADRTALGLVTEHLDRRGPSLLLEAAADCLCAPGLLPLVLQSAENGSGPRQLSRAIRSLGPWILPNEPLDVPGLATALGDFGRGRLPGLADHLARADPAQVSLGILHHVFRPVSLTFSQVRSLLADTRDCCEHVEGSGLRPGGRHWSAGNGCYRFGPAGPDAEGLDLYLSKNVPSLLAKGSVGICTAGDLDLYHRPDHHHLNVADRTTGLVVGNVQLHTLVNRGRRVLLIRAVNATSAYLSADRARGLMTAVLAACAELAAGSEIDEIHLAEGLSYWHLNSSRPEIRVLLEELYQHLPRVTLDRPFFLFRFGRVDLEIDRTCLLWARPGLHADAPRLRHILETVR